VIALGTYHDPTEKEVAILLMTGQNPADSTHGLHNYNSKNILL